MTQSRLGSMVEAVANTVLGQLINFCMNLWVLPLLIVCSVSPWEAIKIGAVFTLISTIRSYVLRRFFNSFKGIK
jgi:hypothetical protein